MDSNHPVFKACTAWCGVAFTKMLAMIGIATWSDAANLGATASACLASIYTLMLIYDHVRRRWRK